MRHGAEPRPNPQGEYPHIATSALIDPTSVLIGNVRIGEEVFVAPGAVIRADEPGSSIVIGDRSNVQDRVVIHALGDSRVVIGSETSLSHACIVHGPCAIGDGCFVGFGSVVLNAVLGDGVVVWHLALVDGVEIGAGRMVRSCSEVRSCEIAEMLGCVDEEAARFARRVVAANRSLLEGYKAKSEPAS